ncbi:MAG TPA: MBOAT family protein [Planctomycetes bacterium]|nr:MBOAT family protein [Planctomycetota bacterium]
MNFNSPQYGLFLLLTFTVYWLLRKRRDQRYLFLLLASWFFYGSWRWPYLFLILGSTLLDYWAGGELAKTDPADPSQQKRRKWLLMASLVGNLGTLAVFKYFNFFMANFEGVFQAMGVSVPQLELLLPPGISFYTFQTLSYTIDIYRGQLRPARNLKEFALFVAFFPQLVAGPIVRARDFLWQLDRRASLDRERLLSGLYRIFVGLGKKILIADLLAVNLVDGVFQHGSQASGWHALLGVYGYALQIYGDFSGYSDIAIGSARILGFEIPENFNAPYIARSIQDFWHRWHISLSTWLRDYLYIPLGGNRISAVRTYVNLMLTMLLGGLWHGAGWNFVFWGGLHGLWLAVNRWWDRRGFGRLGGRLGQFLAILLTFHMVCLAWVFFRAHSFGDAADVLRRIFRGGGVPTLLPGVWVAFVLGFGTHFLPKRVKSLLQQAWVALPAPIVGLLISILLGLFAFSAVKGVPFIYFQF